MKIIKKCMSFFIALSIILNITIINTPNSYTQEVNDIKYGEVENVEVTDKNSIYKEIGNKVTVSNTNSNASSIKSFSSITSAASYMRKQMVKRTKVISFVVNKKYYSTIYKDIFKKAIYNYKGCSSDEGDYLKGNYFDSSCEMVYSGNKTGLVYSFTYHSNYSQEKQVKTKVKQVLNNLNVYEKSDYRKIKAVHDYIVKNIKYDNSLSKFSTYDAIVNKSVVCQGYATLTYKMLRDLGVNCRVIYGTSEGENHAWNIVKIGKRWYNLDNTWDANYYEAGLFSYNYFLKSNAKFDNHRRLSEYNTKSFNKSYPMSTNSYKIY